MRVFFVDKQFLGVVAPQIARRARRQNFQRTAAADRFHRQCVAAIDPAMVAIKSRQRWRLFEGRLDLVDRDAARIIVGRHQQDHRARIGIGRGADRGNETFGVTDAGRLLMTVTRSIVGSPIASRISR